MNKLNRAIIIISRIAEVFCWVGTALSVLIIGVLAAGQNQLLKFLTSATAESPELTRGGFSMLAPADGTGFTAAMLIFFFAVVLITLILTAMIARNVCLIFKTTEGMTEFSTGKTPFQKENIRMIREIGIFLFAIPAVEIIASLIGTLCFGSEIMHSSIALFEIGTGLVVLALSRYFSYGAQLEQEVEGLV